MFTSNGLNEESFRPSIRSALALFLVMSLTPTARAQEIGSSPSNVLALGFQWRDTANGVAIEQVEPTSHAAKLGLMRGDVLTAINGQTVTTADSLATSLAKLAPGDLLRIQFARGKDDMVISMAMPDARVNMFGALLQPAADSQIQVGAISA